MSDIKELIKVRNELLEEERRIYITATNQLNTRYKEVLTNDFGSQLISNSVRDLGGELVRRYFDLGELYITADQVALRILKFDYENEYDPLEKNKEYRKNIYNYFDGSNSSDLNTIIKKIDDSQIKLFQKEKVVQPNGVTKKVYKDINLINKAKRDYKKDLLNKNSILKDEYTDKEETFRVDKDGVKRTNLEVDHAQPLATAKYEDFLSPTTVDELKKIYNSPDNFAMLSRTANTIKGDLKVFVDKNGDQVFPKNAKEQANCIDITYKATPEQMVNALANKLENTKPEIKQKLIDAGDLDENGYLRKKVKNAFKKKIKSFQNKESLAKSKDKNTYKEGGKIALENTKKNFSKIIKGQVIYYVVPPLIYELKQILKSSNVTIDNIWNKLKKSGQRIITYVSSKLKEIFENVFTNTLKSFVKNFFEFLIEMVKATVKKMMKFIKNIALSIIDCARIITNKNASPSEKADSVVNLMSMTVTSCVIEVLGEYIEHQFMIPNIISEPLQFIATILCTNLVMLILQKVDLFNIRYGILVAKLNDIFDDVSNQYNYELDELKDNKGKEMNILMNRVNEDIDNIREELTNIDVYSNDIKETLQKVNDVFDMGIEFDKEWNEFIGIQK